jgi:hypothetical protein
MVRAQDPRAASSRGDQALSETLKFVIVSGTRIETRLFNRRDLHISLLHYGFLAVFLWRGENPRQKP